MNKKIIKFIVFIFVLFSFGIHLDAKATSSEVIGNLEYVYELSEDGTYYIIKDIIENGVEKGDVFFPSKYNNLPIKEVSEEAKIDFYEKIVYFNGTIADWCNITFKSASVNPMNGAGYLYMLDDAGEYYLLDEIIIPEGVEVINDYTFINTNIDFKKIVLPKSIKKIASLGFNIWSYYDLYYAGTIADWCKVEVSSDKLADFSDMIYMQDENGEYYKLFDLVIPDDVTEINEYQFAGFDCVNNIYLSKNVKKIGKSAFSIYPTYGSLYYDGTLTDWCNIDFESYSSNPMDCTSKFYLFDPVNGYVLTENLVIPKNVTKIKQYQFYSVNFKNITMHKKIVEVEKEAFSTNNIDGYLYYEGTIADWCKIKFNGYYSNPLEAVSGFYIANNSSGYSKVTNLIVPGSVKTIGEYQFAGVSGVKTIVIENGVESIGERAFYSVDYVNSITLPNSVKTIDKGAFEYCYNLLNINLPNKLEILEENVLYGADIASLTIPSSIKEIKQQGYNSYLKTIKYEGTFDDWCKITGGYLLMKGITEFYCSDELIKDLIIAEGITCLDNRYIAGYLGLENVYLPKTLENICLGFFGNCDNLVNVYYSGTANDWINISFESETSNPLCYAEHLYIKDNNQYLEVTDLEILDGTTTINAYSFRNFSTLKTITISKDIMNIKTDAFKGCVNLDSVYYKGTLNDWLNIIFENEFSNPLQYVDHFYLLNDTGEYYELKDIIIPEGTKIIGQYQFYGYSYSEKIYIPDSVEEVFAYAFYDTSCRDLELSKNIKKIHNFAFSRNRNKKENLYFRGTVNDWLSVDNEYLDILKTICSMASSEYLLDENNEYQLITEITIPSSFTVIPKNAFSAIKSLEKIIIPSSIEIIDELAFSNLPNLKVLVFEENSNGLIIKNDNFKQKVAEVYYNGTPNSWLKIEFENYTANPVSYPDSKLYFLDETGEYLELKHLVISEEIEKINPYAFTYNHSIEEITISSNLTTIGTSTFTHCNNLFKVNIPQDSNLMTIDSNAFYGCINLTSINLENCKALKTISGSAFYGNSSLEEITIPSSVENIYRSAFGDCTNLIKVIFEENSNLKSISENCFSGSGLIEITIPDSVKIIYDYAFEDCDNLEKVEFGENTLIEEIRYRAFYSSGLDSFKIPKNIKKIENEILGGKKTYYFDGTIIDWSNITFESNILSSSTLLVKDQDGNYVEQTEIVIPKEVKKIPIPFWTREVETLYYEGTINDWLNLEFVSFNCNPVSTETNVYFKNEQGEYVAPPTEIVIPENITRIGNYQFSNFVNLKKVVIHEDVEYLGKYAFSYCYNLEEVEIDKDCKITEILNGTFYSCKKMKKFDTPNYVTTINNDAFDYCYAMASIVLPKSLKSMSSFFYCYNLKVIYNLSEIENDRIYIGNGALIVNRMDDPRVINIDDYLFIKKDGVNYLATYMGNDEHLVLPHTLNGEKYIISDYAFYKKDFIKSIKISDFVTEIGSYAFYDCSELEDVIITKASSITRIRPYAFNNCVNLRYFIVPKNITEFSSYYDMFVNCPNIKVVYNLSTYSEGSIKYVFPKADVIYSSIESNVFIEYEDFLFIRKYDEYELIDYLGEDVNIVFPIEIEGIGYTIDKDIFRDNRNIESLVITKGVLGFDDYAFSNLTKLKSVTFQESVITELSENLFSCCENLESFIIPDGISEIPAQIFNECSNLQEVIIPNTVTSIGNGAFMSCISLKEIDIPNTVTNIGSSAFNGCTSLEKAFINKNITILNNSIFNTCISLKEVIFEEGCNITSIEGFAFNNCQNLEEITLPSSVTSIGQYAFYNCSKLNNIELNDNITTIGDSAFAYCTSLEEIKIPKGVTILERETFYNCSNLQTIYLNNNIVDFGIMVFSGCDKLQKVYYSGTINNWNDINFEYSNPIDNIEEFYILKDNQYELVETIIFDNEIMKINYQVFKGYKGLKKIVLSSSIKEIDRYAFYDCINLEEIEFVGGLEIINSSSFSNCTSLTSVEIPSGVTIIGDDAFYGCTSLESVKIPASVTSIGSWSFLKCTSLQNITVDSSNNNYKSIDGNLYTKDGSTLLLYASGKEEELVVIPEGVKIIGFDAFKYAIKNKTIKLPMSLMKIEYSSIFVSYNFKVIVYENSYGYNFALENNLEYEVVEVEIIPGDLNKDLQITIDDVIYLLMYTYFPSSYEINQYPDFNKDGVINTDDAIYLLMHTYFSEQYPLS